LSYVERLKKLCLTTVNMRRLRRDSSEMSCHCVYVSCSCVIHVVTDRCQLHPCICCCCSAATAACQRTPAILVRHCWSFPILFFVNFFVSFHVVDYAADDQLCSIHNAFVLLALYMLLFFLSSPSGSSDIIQACNHSGVKLCFRFNAFLPPW